MVISFVMTPTTSSAAPARPQQVGPSSYIPLLRNNYCSGQRSTDIPLGTQLYGSTGYNQPHFRLLQDTRSPWLRNTLHWSAVEPTNVAPNQYNWSGAESTFLATTQNCLNMIVTIEGTPDWAVMDGNIDGRSPIKPENVADFVEFVTALVERYDGDGIADSPRGIVVNHWEIYNEPDFGSEIGGSEGWGNYAQNYADLLKAIYAPMHAANPNVNVVFGGIAYNLFVENGAGLFERDFLKNVLDAGAGDYFDVMNFHYYPFEYNRVVWVPDKNTSGLREKFDSVKAELVAHGLNDKKYMITEMGWHSNVNEDHPSTPEYQARRVPELLSQAMSVGSLVSIWWTFFNERQDFPYETGLTTADDNPTAKPSYVAYQEAIRRLGNSEYVGVTVEPTAQNDLEAYQFRDKSTNKTFYVAWVNPIVPFDKAAELTYDNSVTQNLSIPGSNATLFTKEGTQLQTVNDGDDGASDNTITVTVGRSPIYIVIN